MNIVVTGDVDAGKSTLIGRILYEKDPVARKVFQEMSARSAKAGREFPFAFLLDSFQEERSDELTMDTTQVPCKSRQGACVQFIDVPGHRHLLRHMLSGSSYAHHAVLVIDVQKSVVEQTRRHVFILSLLGIREIIAVLNKMDRVDFAGEVYRREKSRIDSLASDMRVRLKECIPVSAQAGDNVSKASARMPWYRGPTVWRALAVLKVSPARGGFRFPVQDVYASRGKRIMVGEVLTGSVRCTSRIRCFPSGNDENIKVLWKGEKQVRSVSAPENIGIELRGDPAYARGALLCAQPYPVPVRECRLKLFCTRRLSLFEALNLQCVTQQTECVIQEIYRVWDVARGEDSGAVGSTIEPDCAAEVRIVMKDPIVLEPFSVHERLGRCVVHRGADIAAVGIVLSLIPEVRQ